MALVLNDRVKETTTTTGTGTINLAGAATNFETFVAGIGDGNTVYYAIVHQDQPEFEVGLGTVTDATPDTLSRTTILSSSNSDGLVSFSAGTKDVFCTLPASKTVFKDASGSVGALVANGHISTGSNSGRLRAGASNEVELSHSGSHGELDCDTGNFLIDVVGDITLDADGADIKLSDGGTEFGRFTKNGNDFELRSTVTNGDFKIIGERTSGTVTAMTIDMSDGGAVSFNSKITSNNLQLENAQIAQTSGDLTIDVAGDITLDADGADIKFSDGGSHFFSITKSSTHALLHNPISNGDIQIKGLDDGSAITAITIDMSEAGTATFNHDIKLGDNGIAIFGDSSDLQIYHDGTHSYVANGTNTLYLRTASSLQIENSDGSEDLATFAVNGAATLFHDNSAKLATTSTGVDVTGTVVADGLTVDSGTTNTVATFTSTDAGAGFNLTDDSGTSTIQTNGANLRIGVDEDAAVSSSAIQFRVDGSTKATINDSGVLDVDGGITVDNITIDGTEIDLSSGDLTIDVAGDIVLDCGNGDINLQDDGTQFGSLENDGTNFIVKSERSDADMVFKGNDGGSSITALTLDMSDAGTGIFNHDVRVGDNSFFIGGAGDDITMSSDGTHGKITTGNGNFSVDCANTIKLDADDGEIQFLDAGTEIGIILMTNQDFKFESKVQDKDIIFRGNDGGSEINALALDMSEGGHATFNNNVTAFSDERLKDNIETLEDGLDKVEQLRGVTYTRYGKENIGVIAQEVEKIIPEIVLTADDEMGTKSVDYSRITAVLIEAVKELSARVKELENK